MRVFFLLKILYRGAKEVLSPALTSNPDPPPVFYGITSTCVLMHRVLGLPGIASLFRQDRPARCKEKEYILLSRFPSSGSSISFMTNHAPDGISSEKTGTSVSIFLF
ncbi:hypothetical protein NC652_026589 [Populus alba x Populus x berolinensis]|nr:hypothetical protein NC652_026589 [Populus alba x Populus x berolinensis]